MTRKFRECVLLLEDEHGLIRFRPVILTQPGVNQIIERVHVDQQTEIPRVWVCRNGERDDLRQVRLFREVLMTPPPPDTPESPVFDELHVKEPLPFTLEDALKR